MITIAQYVGIHAASPDLTAQRMANAVALLAAVNPLLEDLLAGGIKLRTNPKTGTLISGETFGGFRPQACPIGTPGSAHKEGQGVDLFDPFGSIGAFLLARETVLHRHGLFMENPAATPTWCHVQTRKTRSGMRVFNP